MKRSDAGNLFKVQSTVTLESHGIVLMSSMSSLLILNKVYIIAIVGEILVGEIFSEILLEGTKRGGIQCFMVVQWGNLSRLVNFFLMSCKNNLFILIWGRVQNINYLTVAMS